MKVLIVCLPSDAEIVGLGVDPEPPASPPATEAEPTPPPEPQGIGPKEAAAMRNGRPRFAPASPHPLLREVRQHACGELLQAGRGAEICTAPAAAVLRCFDRRRVRSRDGDRH
jgi:hypothetical protein